MKVQIKLGLGWVLAMGESGEELGDVLFGEGHHNDKYKRAFILLMFLNWKFPLNSKIVIIMKSWKS